MPLIPSLATAAHHARVLAPYYLADRPASVQANPVILMFSIFGLLGGSMLMLEIISRVVSDAIGQPRPWKHPVTIVRLRSGLGALGVLLYIGPDAVSFMFWPDVTPQTRYAIAITNRLLDSLALIPLSGAWMIGIYGQRTIAYQLSRHPIPVNLWPTWKQLHRPLKIGLLLLILSMGLSLGR